MMYALYRQWRRSNLIGFIRRVRNYMYGRTCVNPLCRAMMQLTEQFRVGECMRERWVCEKCGSGMGEIY